MPIYEYVCTTCGKEFEVMQKFSDPELKIHDCSPKSKVQKKLSLTSFHLQGGGWYASGYGSGGNGGGAKSATPAPATSGDSGGSAKADKPAKSSGTGSTAEGKSTSGISAAGGCGAGCACH